jgi:double-stranded uracil-DNA glycosylase
MTGPSSTIPDCSRGFPPLSGPEPRILILGSFPSVLSLARTEYYGNPKNRFWAVMEEVFGVPAALPYPERTRCLVREGIALWDVAASCSRPGSADARIRDAVPNDIAGFVFDHPSVQLIALNGRMAGRLYHRLAEVPDVPADTFPSTSPANAAVPFREKVRTWRRITDFR